MKFKYLTLACGLAGVFFAACSSGSGGNSCESIAEKMRSCEVLTSGSLDCDGVSGTELGCVDRCFRQASCGDIVTLYCGGDNLSGAEALLRCIVNCEDQFQCRDGSGSIPAHRACDGVLDCPDGSDELGCSDSSSGGFTCNDGTVIPEVWVCDGDLDCPDGSDEANCETFTCDSGETIPASWECDGWEDCVDGSDERDCSDSGQAQLTCPG